MMGVHVTRDSKLIKITEEKSLTDNVYADQNKRHVLTSQCRKPVSFTHRRDIVINKIRLDYKGCE